MKIKSWKKLNFESKSFQEEFSKSKDLHRKGHDDY